MARLNYFNYFTEIEDTFIRRRGKNLFLSPLDWALMETWQERGIPLHIVLRSVEAVFDVFDKQPPGTRTIKSLFYCREEIEAQYAEWTTSRTGMGSESAEPATAAFPTDSISAHIRNAIDQLDANTNDLLRKDIARAVARLEELLGNLTNNPEKVDSTLADIEKLIERAMLTNWETSHLKALEKEVASHLRSYKAEMEPEAYQKTFELMLLKRLREDANIPRLSLFYL